MSRPAPDPRELVPGWSARSRSGIADYAGVLRAGYRQVWACPPVHGHRHITPALARRCAADEQERRVRGAEQVLTVGHCVPCWAFWDLGRILEPPGLAHQPGGAVYDLMKGTCPQCSVPFARVKVIVLGTGGGT